MNKNITRLTDASFENLMTQHIQPLLDTGELAQSTIDAVQTWIGDTKNSHELAQVVHALNEELKISKTLKVDAKLMEQLERKMKILDITSAALNIIESDNKPKTMFEEGVKLAASHVAGTMIAAPIGVYVGATLGSIVPGAGTIAGAAAGYAIGEVIDTGAGLMADALFDGETKKITQAMTNDNAQYESTFEHVVALGIMATPVGQMMQVADGTLLQTIKKDAEAVRQLF